MLTYSYLCSVIYPNNFEHKLGFDEIRRLLKARCQSTLGQEKVDEMTFSADTAVVNELLSQVREFRRLTSEHDDFPMQYFFDVRESIARIRLENTHLEEDEVWDLRRSLETIANIVRFLQRNGDEKPNGEVVYPYPALYRLTDGVATFPAMIRRIDSILDKFGKIKDSASMTLASIRHDLEKTQGSISRTLYTILHAAQRDGLVDKDAAPAMRDGRLVIPVQPQLKRKINGIVHDESATGKTVFIEPTEVVEANNKVRQLEAEERREVIRILTVFTDEVRPHVREIIDSYQLLAMIDLIQAKAKWAELTKAYEPTVKAEPVIDWIRAVHPLLQLSLEKKGGHVVPLDIMLKREKRLLLISGPNAGGKSVCLKTVGLLQYMLQCGLPIPISERSTVGTFQSIMIDIGDEQSIENDLSTYSSHLMNMKQMMKQADEHSLLLIDEFGSGTEPTIGGASLCVMFLQDQREMEARLRTEKLAAMGRMSAAVAHEIRNPLAAITQANALLAEELDESSGLAPLIGMVQQNAQRLGRIVDDVLDVARAQGNTEGGHAAEQLALDESVRAFVGEWAGQHGSGTRLVVNLGAEGAYVQFSAEHLRRVLVNLLDNAARYATRSDAALQVATLALRHGPVRLLMWSDGSPLDAGVQRHLFEPFFTSESRSSGLGLFLCRELCERHGAAISYERMSRSQGGSERPGNGFFINFRRLPAPSAAPEATHEEQA